jgi:hypothetical protein
MVAVAPVRSQTAPARQVPNGLVEELYNTPEGAATVTLTAVYVPAATSCVVMKFVSDCSRVNSKSADGFEEKTETALPLEGVRVMPMIGNVKLTMDVFVGGVSEMVMLSDVSPPPQLVVHALCSPLHELNAKANVAATTSNRRDFLGLISRTPLGTIYRATTTGLGRPHQTDRTAGIPQNTVALWRTLLEKGKSHRVQLLTVRGSRHVHYGDGGHGGQFSETPPASEGPPHKLTQEPTCKDSCGASG